MPTFQVRFNWVSQGQEMKNVTYWDIPTTGANPLLNFADGVRDSVNTHLASSLSNTCTLESVTLREMTGGGAFSFEQGFSAGPLTGSSASTPFDPTSPLLVSYRANAPKPNRGYMNIPGMTEAVWDGQGFDTTVRSAAEAMIIDWANGLSLPQGDATLYIARPDFLTNTWAASNTIDSLTARQYSGKRVSRRPS